MSRDGRVLLGGSPLLLFLAMAGCGVLEKDVDATGTGTRVWQEGSLEGISTPLTLVLTQEMTSRP
jgi:hypothetical protein